MSKKHNKSKIKIIKDEPVPQERFCGTCQLEANKCKDPSHK